MILKCAALSLSLATFPATPIDAHDIYSDLLDVWGKSCCDDRDCRPALYRFTEGKLQMLVDQRWIDVPGETVLYRTLPGDTGETWGGHWCGGVHGPTEDSIESLHVTRCAILPPSAAEAQ